MELKGEIWILHLFLNVRGSAIWLVLIVPTEERKANACLLDEEWIDHLKEYKFQIGVSLDGTPDIHDKTRVFARDGKGSFHKVNEGLELLGKSGINFGILTVISENMLEKSPCDLFHFFEEKSIRRFALLSLRKN